MKLRDPLTGEPQEHVKSSTNTADALGDNDEARTPAQEAGYSGGTRDRHFGHDVSCRLVSFRQCHKHCVSEHPGED
jgi:hypothetical protein